MENLPVRIVANVQRPSNIERKDLKPSIGSNQSKSRIRGAQCGSSYNMPLHRHRKEHYGYLDGYANRTYREAQSYGSLHGACSTNDSIQHAYVHTLSQLFILPGHLDSCAKIYGQLPCWDWIAQIVCFVNDDIACPICLEQPKCPRMEKCGHIYCWPCAIQYINYENDCSSKKCAVCTSPLNLTEMKRVSLKYHSTLTIGSSLEMVLVKRTGGAFDVHPVSEGFPQHYQFIQELKSDVLCAIADEECASLEAYKVVSLTEGDTEIIPYINYALDCISSEKESYVKNRKQDACSSNMQCTSTEKNGISPAQHESEFRFYQASDGQLIYLDGLMWKCLLAEFQDVNNLPSSLTVTINSVRTMKMSSLFRRRWRYLSHLPIGCSFSLIEFDIESIISEDTAVQFESVLKRRHLERDRRMLEDLHLTRLKEEAENRIPFLPEGFSLSGHAELSGSSKVPSDADFVPLCAGFQKPVVGPSSTGASFAEVTKSGALSVVGRDRVANFPRTPATGSRQLAFDSNMESWPSLNDASIGESHTIGWQPMIKSTGENDVNNSHMEHVPPNPSKKQRKRRSRLDSHEN